MTELLHAYQLSRESIEESKERSKGQRLVSDPRRFVDPHTLADSAISAGVGH